MISRGKTVCLKAVANLTSIIGGHKIIKWSKRGLFILLEMAKFNASKLPYEQ